MIVMSNSRASIPLGLDTTKEYFPASVSRAFNIVRVDE